MEDEIKSVFKAGFGFIAVMFIAIIIFGCFYTIPAGYRGVELTFGKPSEIVSNEGLHFKIPIVQSIAKMEVRTQMIKATADSSSKDLQDIQTVVALNFHVIPEETKELYQKIGMSYSERIIEPTIQEAVKAVTAKFTAEELITKRAEVRNGIKDFLTERLISSYIKVDDFNIVNFQFSEEFDKAIEAKVTAEQLRLKAGKDLERIIIEKEQKITKAQAEAEALRLQKMEITPELIKLRQIEMMMAAIAKWDGVMPDATSGMPFIDITPESLNG